MPTKRKPQGGGTTPAGARPKAHEVLRLECSRAGIFVRRTRNLLERLDRSQKSAAKEAAASERKPALTAAATPTTEDAPQEGKAMEVKRGRAESLEAAEAAEATPASGPPPSPALSAQEHTHVKRFVLLSSDLRLSHRSGAADCRLGDAAAVGYELSNGCYGVFWRQDGSCMQVLHDAEEEEGECILYVNSNRHSLAFVSLSSSPTPAAAATGDGHQPAAALEEGARTAANEGERRVIVAQSRPHSAGQPIATVSADALLLLPSTLIEKTRVLWKVKGWWRHPPEGAAPAAEAARCSPCRSLRDDQLWQSTRDLSPTTRGGARVTHFGYFVDRNGEGSGGGGGGGGDSWYIPHICSVTETPGTGKGGLCFSLANRVAPYPGGSFYE